MDPRRRRRCAQLVTACAAVLVGGGCGADEPGGGAGGRPATKAELSIVAPANGSVIAADVDVEVRLDGGRIVAAAQTTPEADAGHIHLSVDGRVVSLQSGLSDRLTGLSFGPHTIEAEFVAADHLPFARRVTARSLVVVEAP